MNWTLLCQLIVLFFVFSVLGWMMEVTLKYIQYHRFINRGFLIGPYCPIYGSGVVLVTVLLIHGQDDHFVPVRIAYENQAACASPLPPSGGAAGRPRHELLYGPAGVRGGAAPLLGKL